jgi:site-specific DNA-cytosine methylase
MSDSAPAGHNSVASGQLQSIIDRVEKLEEEKASLLEDMKYVYSEAKGNGFGYGLVGPDDVSRTMSARYYKDGSEILIAQDSGRIPRRLTPRECARLMGYPESFKIVVSDTQAYRQFGNSVVVPVVERIAQSVSEALCRPAGETPDLILTLAERANSKPVDIPRVPVRYAKAQRAKSTPKEQ